MNVPITLPRLLTDIKKQYDTLESRLSLPNQTYLALPDRPTIADIANLLFADYETSKRMGLDINDWPNLKAWGERMHAIEGIKKVFEAREDWKQELVPEAEEEVNGVRAGTEVGEKAE